MRGLLSFLTTSQARARRELADAMLREQIGMLNPQRASRWRLVRCGIIHRTIPGAARERKMQRNADSDEQARWASAACVPTSNDGAAYRRNGGSESVPRTLDKTGALSPGRLLGEETASRRAEAPSNSDKGQKEAGGASRRTGSTPGREAGGHAVPAGADTQPTRCGCLFLHGLNLCARRKTREESQSQSPAIFAR